MFQNSRTEVAVAAKAATTSQASNMKRFAQMAGAAVLSAGLVGTFALPAYATSPTVVAGQGPDTAVLAKTPQTLTVADTVDLPATVEDSKNIVDADKVAAEARQLREEADELAEEAEAEAEAEALALNEQNEAPAPAAKPAADVPSGAGASSLSAAALAQLGVGQDCTDMVQNALAAVGKTTRRDQGGYDMGVNDFAAFGTPVGSGSYAPGDILIWPGMPHVAIYIGNGQAVHGGWAGNNTAIGPVNVPGAPGLVIRG